MSDFARMMELAIAGGANPEEISGMPPPPTKADEKGDPKPAPQTEHRESREKK